MDLNTYNDLLGVEIIMTRHLPPLIPRSEKEVFETFNQISKYP